MRTFITLAQISALPTWRRPLHPIFILLKRPMSRSPTSPEAPGGFIPDVGDSLRPEAAAAAALRSEGSVEARDESLGTGGEEEKSSPIPLKAPTTRETPTPDKQARPQEPKTTAHEK
ncbi:hypothetical protein K438DRAFT_1938422, partial [Mycena galopus ATCC 62051]